jgi:steroid Delta-isomerase
LSEEIEMIPIHSSYLEYFEKLSPDNVHLLRELAVPQMHFSDPFNDVNSVEDVIGIFSDMFKKLKDPRFEIVNSIADGDRLFVLWNFRFKTPLLNWGRELTVAGTSFVEAGAEGKIVNHVDYWDASTQIYFYIPVFGSFLKIVRSFIS